MFLLDVQIQVYQITLKLRLLLKPGRGPWKRTLKNLDPEKHATNIVLKYMSDFRELYFINALHNVTYCLKVRVRTDIETTFFRLKIVLATVQWKL